MRTAIQSSENLELEINNAEESMLSRFIPYLIYFLFLIPFTLGCMISLLAYDEHILVYFPESFLGGKAVNTILWSFTTASFPLGGWIGTFLASFLGNLYSRKTLTKLFIFIGIVGSIFHTVSYSTKLYAFLFLSRFLHGFGSGGTMNVGLIYFFEIIPPEKNTIVGAIIQPIINAGIFWSSLFSLESICGTKWFIANLFLLIFLVICLLVLLVLPQSPYYIYLKMGNLNQATKILSKLRHKKAKDVQDELDTIIKKKDEISTISSTSIGNFLRNKKLRGAIIVTTMIAVFQQISGINIVIFYCTIFIKEIGFKKLDLGNLIMFSVCFIGSFLFMFILPNSESKLMMVVGFFSMSISFFIAFTTTLLKLNSIVNVFYLSLFLFWFQCGPGPKMWNIFNETFPLQYQASAQGFLTFCNWLANFLMALIFPFIREQINIYSVLLFAIINLIFGIILQIFMVKNIKKTTEQIIDDYQNKFSFLS